METRKYLETRKDEKRESYSQKEPMNDFLREELLVISREREYQTSRREYQAKLEKN